jgi:hypothetical protein
MGNNHVLEGARFKLPQGTTMSEGEKTPPWGHDYSLGEKKV